MSYYNSYGENIYLVRLQNEIFLDTRVERISAETEDKAKEDVLELIGSNGDYNWKVVKITKVII